MTYNVSLPLTGISGWKFLERTEEKQKAAFEKSVEIQRTSPTSPKRSARSRRPRIWWATAGC